MSLSLFTATLHSSRWRFLRRSCRILHRRRPAYLPAGMQAPSGVRWMCHGGVCPEEHRRAATWQHAGPDSMSRLSRTTVWAPPGGYSGCFHSALPSVPFAQFSAGLDGTVCNLIFGVPRLAEMDVLAASLTVGLEADGQSEAKLQSTVAKPSPKRSHMNVAPRAPGSSACTITHLFRLQVATIAPVSRPASEAWAQKTCRSIPWDGPHVLALRSRSASPSTRNRRTHCSLSALSLL